MSVDEKFIRINFGSMYVKHGQTKTAVVSITQPGRVAQLYPWSDSHRCIGSLATKCACYVNQKVSWNVSVGQILSEQMLPFTASCTISCFFTKGEYYGDHAGEPCPEMHLSFGPHIGYKVPIISPPPPPPECTLTIASEGPGTPDPAPGSYVFDEGETVKILAMPLPTDANFNAGFNNWTVDGSTYTQNPIEVKVMGDSYVTAHFSGVPPPPTGETYVVYREGEPQQGAVPGTGDTRSAELIAKTYGFTLRPLTATELAEGFVPGDIYPGCNLVLVGGADTNPYSKLYFPESTGGCGVTPPYVIGQKSRDGNTVTLVAGCEEKDTWTAARKFCGKLGLPLWVKVLGGVAVVGGVFYGVTRLFGKRR